MRFLINKFSAFMAALLICSAVTLGFSPADAAASPTISLSSDSVNVGDTIVVTVSGADKSFSLSYDNNMLTLVDGPGTASGNKIKVKSTGGQFTFQGEASGNADMVLSVGGTNIASCVIPVNASSDTEASAGSDTDSETDTSSEPDTSSENTTSEASSDTKKYSQKTYLGKKSFNVTPEKPEYLLSARMIQTTLVTKHITTELAYRLKDGAGDFYYIYGTDNDGNVGWFMWDDGAQRLSAADSYALSLIPDTDETAADSEESSGLVTRVKSLISSKNRMPLIIIICIVIAAIIIIAVVRHRRYDDYDEYDDDDDVDDDDDTSGADSEGSDDEKKKSGGIKFFKVTPETAILPDITEQISEKEAAATDDLSDKIADQLSHDVTEELSETKTDREIFEEGLNDSEETEAYVPKPRKKSNEDDLNIVDLNDL